MAKEIIWFACVRCGEKLAVYPAEVDIAETLHCHYKVVHPRATHIN